MSSIKKGRHETKEPKKTNKLMLLLLCFILLYAVTYSIKFYGGTSYLGDDNAYANFAYQVTKGNFAQNTDILSVRIMQIYPIAFFYWISNYSFYANAAWDIFSYLATIVIVFLLGKEIYDERVGLLGSLLFAFFPMMAILSVTMSDNPPMTFFISLGMLSLLYARRKGSAFWYILSAMAFMGAVLIIPLGLIGLAVGILYIIVEFIRGKIDRKIINFGFGIAIVLILLFSFNYLTTKQPLITFKTTFSFYDTVGGPNAIVPANTNFPFYFQVMFPYKITTVIFYNLEHSNFNPISIWNQIYIINYNWVGFYFYVAVGAILYLLYKKEKKAYFILFWFIVGFLLMEFDPLHISFSPFVYLLQHRLERYLTLIAPPLALLISMAIIRFVSGVKSKWKYLRYAIAAAIVIFLITTAIPVFTLYHNLVSVESYDNIKISNYLLTLPTNTKIFIHSGQFIPIDMGFSNYSRYYIYDEISNCSMIPPNSYIVLPKYQEYSNLSYTPNPSSSCPSWQLVLYPNETVNYSGAVTGPAQVFRTDLYYVPKNTS